MIEKISDWYMANEKNKIIVYVSVIVILIVLSFGWWVFKSRMEASAFNRITESQVTTWDAMWVQLRVDRPTTD